VKAAAGMLGGRGADRRKRTPSSRCRKGGGGLKLPGFRDASCVHGPWAHSRDPRPASGLSEVFDRGQGPRRGEGSGRGGEIRFTRSILAEGGADGRKAISTRLLAGSLPCAGVQLGLPREGAFAALWERPAPTCRKP